MHFSITAFPTIKAFVFLNEQEEELIPPLPVVTPRPPLTTSPTESKPSLIPSPTGSKTPLTVSPALLIGSLTFSVSSGLQEIIVRLKSKRERIMYKTLFIFFLHQ
ncbi:MAG: hypothetical protein P8L36_15350 [SAR324 cluster bacterium]|nr:hypothetical protein [SAR324 cluster bacterium]